MQMGGEAGPLPGIIGEGGAAEAIGEMAQFHLGLHQQPGGGVVPLTLKLEACRGLPQAIAEGADEQAGDDGEDQEAAPIGRGARPGQGTGRHCYADPSGAGRAPGSRPGEGLVQVISHSPAPGLPARALEYGR
ncbi:MAG: hypothetical protein EBY30_01750 [Rhodospirillales bacterium]|nr:hypothetical protein [Rhodospirillales bacterium]